MELVIFARIHAREEQEKAVAEALREQVPKARAEPGRMEIAAYRSTRDPCLFWIHSRWIDEAAFEVHATLPNTQRFVVEMQALIDHPFEARARSRSERFRQRRNAPTSAAGDGARGPLVRRSADRPASSAADSGLSVQPLLTCSRRPRSSRGRA